MSRKIAYVLVASGLMFSLVEFASAQDTQDSAMTASVKSAVNSQKERLQEKRKEIETKVENKKEEVKKKLETARADLVRMYITRMSNRYDAAINRLDNLAGRISSRLDKFAQDGQDVKVFQKSLDAAKINIDTAKTKLAETKTALSTVADSEMPKTDFETARKKLSETKDAIKEAHTALVDVVNSVKGTSNKK